MWSWTANWVLIRYLVAQFALRLSHAKFLKKIYSLSKDALMYASVSPVIIFAWCNYIAICLIPSTRCINLDHRIGQALIGFWEMDYILSMPRQALPFRQLLTNELAVDILYWEVFENNCIMCAISGVFLITVSYVWITRLLPKNLCW